MAVGQVRGRRHFWILSLQWLNGVNSNFSSRQKCFKFVAPLKSGNVFYHSVQNLLSSSLLFKNINIKIYWTTILPAVLFGCEIWSPALREERRLRVIDHRVLRRIFGPKRDEVTGDWRKLHKEELHYLYSSSNFVRVI